MTQSILKEDNIDIYKMLIENSLDGIFIIQNRKMKFVNSAFADMLGYEISEIIGSEFINYVSEQSKKLVEERYRKRLNGEDIPSEYKFFLLKKDGTTKLYVNMRVKVVNFDNSPASMGIVKDITTQHNIQNALLERERELSSVINAIPYALWSSKMDNNQNESNFYYSPVIFDITGIKSAKFISKEVRYWDIIHKDDINNIKKGYKEALIKCTDFTHEYRIIHADGSIKWVRENIRFIKDDDSSTSLYGIITDITEAKLANLTEQAIYKISEAVNLSGDIDELYSKIYSIIRTLIPIKNIYIALYNKYSNEISFPFFIDEYDVRPKTKQLGKGLTEYVIKSGKSLLVNKQRDFELRNSGIIERIGSPLAVWLGIALKTSEDIIGALVIQDYEDEYAFGEKEKNILTFVSDQIALAIERVRTRVAMKQSESEYRAIFENAHDAIIVFRPDDEIILAANARAGELYGLKVNELIGRSLRDFTVDVEAGKEKINQVLKNGVMKNIESVHYKSDGSIFEVEHNGSIFNFHGEDVILSMNRDISVRKKNEKEIQKHINALQKSERELKESERELKESNDQKDLFFSIIAHDLRSPFSSLLGFTQFMVQEADTLSKEEFREFSANIDKTARNVYNLLENLLQWARMKTGKMEFSPRNININEMILDVIDLYQPNAFRKKISLISKFNEENYVFADSNMLNTVLRNLVSNSIKFTDENGQIEICAKALNNHIEIKIADDGVGIPDESLKHIFNIDKRVSTVGTAKERGTGLGLILCQEFVNKNGGNIKVESEEGRGSSFIFTVPIAINN